MQMDLLWACGREAFGIKPNGPLKIVTIQAENDRGDLYYMSEGITKGLGLSQEEILAGWENLKLVHEQSRTGESFVREVVEPLLREHRPDLIRIDPLLAYAGGDMTKPEVSGRLLRSLSTHF
jgi:RecA-family ATPase